MQITREVHRVGADYLNTVTALLHRVRNVHPTAGLLEAADLQWWWRSPRSTDAMPQLFWLDDRGHPEAAVIATDWGDGVALDPIVMPGATPGWVAHVIDRGLAHARALGFQNVDVVVDSADTALRAALAERGFTVEHRGVGDAWLAADAPPVSNALPAGYRLASRRDTAQRPHHMVERSGPEVEARLRQTSLYRAELDLVVLDARESVAAYGLFWLDPHTATGLVEPMRTEREHQRRGLARHVLTTGIGLLAQAGAARVKLCFEPHNTAARALYLSVGFQPDKQTLVVKRAGASTA
jgi:GNAT superfamily N-acetyltransferase